jgi:methylated-DNA-[protein]-cysteine S-methyltransferase
MNLPEVNYAVIESPIGRLLAIGDGAALCGLYMEAHKRGPAPTDRWRRDDDSLRFVAEQIEAYFAGELKSFDLPCVTAGTPFQRQVWTALRDTGYGETITYGQLAQRVGAPSAARAVGAAVGRNPLSIIVPCHRAVGSDGSLTGFAGGLPRKRWLLEHEQAVLAESNGRTAALVTCGDAGK